MKNKVFVNVYFFFILIGIQFPVFGQPVVNFTLPDSSCVGAQINITNLTTGGSTFYWSFCSGNANTNPTGVNIGNPGNVLNIPTYLTLAQDATSCYSFISCQQGGVIRYFHGSSFSNYPISWTILGTFGGLLVPSIEGIQVKEDNGNWYGFVNDNTTLVRLDFGNSLANTPTATNLGPFTGLHMLHGLVVIKQDTTWLAFANCSTGDKFVRFDFGTSLSNIPTLTDFGNFGILTSPCALCIVEENSLWYGLTMDVGLVRLTFGNSLLNTPTAENLGNPGGFDVPGGLTIIRDCDLTSGYFTNYLTNGQLGKLLFAGGIDGTVTGQVLGNIGNLNLPHSFSEIFRQNDTLFAYITNRGSNTLTQLTFPPCTNASIPSSTLFNPPPFSYSQTGTYNVRLLVDEGLPDQVSLCKTIVIEPAPTVNLGPDQSICPGTSATLDAGPGFTSYLWSTNATTRTINVSAAGTYSVIVTQTGCTATDTVNISLLPIPVVNLGPDSSVCPGQSVTFDAGACTGCSYLWVDLGSGLPVGTSQTYTTNQAGGYKVTVTNANGCQAKDSVQLSNITPPVETNNPLSESICSGGFTNIILTANPPSATFSWIATSSSGFVSGYSSGTGSIINQELTNSNIINETVTYHITPAIGNCPGDTVPYVVTIIPQSVVNINISASANNVCAGIPVTFTATPIHGGTSPSYQWKVNGTDAGTNSNLFTYLPSDNDAVSCLMTSNLNCVTGNPATSNIVIMTINSNPAISFTSCFDTITTVNAKPIILKGGIPLGGTYSGPGVNPSTGVFTPSIAGTGTKTIVYSYTNAVLCTASKSFHIIVQAVPGFTCGNNLTDIRDNKVYPTVQIGSQCWLASNLNYGTELISTQDQRDNCVWEKYCYNDNPTNCISLGGLYQWDEVMQYDDTPAGQGFCPPAWHIPTENDWNTLFANWTNNGFAGSPLKYSGYSGFDALLSGANHFNSSWDFQGFATFFWSSTLQGSTKAWAHGMNNIDPSVSEYPSSRVNAFSVRCLHD